MKWISAARPRTLFLAVASVILGSGVAKFYGAFDPVTFMLALLLAITMQVLANFANDLGDFDKGTDITGKREGPARAMQSGKITKSEMLSAIRITSVFASILGLVLVIINLKSIVDIIVMAVIGAFCILAAIFYTVGKNAYGYKGLGDIFAFLFFGPVPVIGTFFLYTHHLNFMPVLPSIGLGIISAMVLNINNMRDIDNDQLSGKSTIAVKLGLKNAKFYHVLLTFFMFASFIGFSIIFAPTPWYRYLYVIVFVLYFKYLGEINAKKERELDVYLRKTSICGFILSILFVLCINL